MKQLFRHFVFLIFLCFLSSSCSTWKSFKDTLTEEISFEMSEGHQVQVLQKAWVKTSSNSPKEVKAGETLEVKDTPLMIESPGHIGVLVLPPGVTPKNVKLNLRPISSWAGDATKQYAGQLVSDILSKVQEVQVLLGKGESDEALKKAEALRAAHPGVSYLKFLEASCLLVLGKNNQAKTLLKSALVDHPEDENARSLFLSLSKAEGDRQ